MRDYIRPKAAAAKLGVSSKLIYKLVDQRQVESVRLGGAVLILVDSLEAYLAKNTRAAGSAAALVEEATPAPASSKSPRQSRVGGFVFLPPRQKQP